MSDLGKGIAVAITVYAVAALIVGALFGGAVASALWWLFG